MNILIHSTIDDSPAHRVGIEAGQQVLAINGRCDLEDMFDYQFEVTDCETLHLKLGLPDGSEKEVVIDKEADEDPGMIFTSPVFTPIKICNNACPFCFIDQQPQGLRESLYIKDDDWRLSYFSNTYITLTNLTEHDRRRIEMIRPGPLYVSVHSTVPEVRIQMLKNPKFAGHIMKELRWLADLGIPFHCQVVVCPGINDGEPLSQTLRDLYSLYPEAESVAVIPVGLTEHREHLPKLNSVDSACAQETIARVEAFRKETGARDFVFLSDEFYFKAGLPLPAYEEYGEFPQLDDGVGTARMLIQDFYDLSASLPPRIDACRKILVLTGKLAAMTLDPIVRRLNEIENLYLDVLAVESRFWGQQVDVAGLITGADLKQTLNNQENLDGYAFAVIPAVMLKQDSELFLDGTSVSQLSETFQLPFRIVQDSYSAREFLEVLELI